MLFVSKMSTPTSLDACTKGQVTFPPRANSEVALFVFPSGAATLLVTSNFN